VKVMGRAIFFTTILTFLLVSVTKAVSPQLQVLYINRRPYYFCENGEARGILVDISRKIFKEAHIRVRYRLSSPSRILWIIRQGPMNVCSIGWFKTPQREKFAKFSLPIYQNRPLVVLTLKRLKPRFKGIHTLQQLFKRKGLRWGRLVSFSYGDMVDSLAKALSPTRVSITGSQILLIRMLFHGRIDYILLSPEEIPFLVKHSGYPAKDLISIPLKDISRGNKRYIMFSRRVSDSLIQRINRAIKKLMPSLYREEN